MPLESDALARAALVRFSEARRPARLNANGAMVPLSEQDPALWDRSLINEGMAYFSQVARGSPIAARVIRTEIHARWCRRRALSEPAPWPDILALYDHLISIDDNPIVRLNRAVAVAEVQGPAAAWAEVAGLDRTQLEQYAPYHAVRADLLRRLGDRKAAGAAYDAAIDLVASRAERAWLEARRAQLVE
jgi:RNA polymerase sigma-70 factor (ECF subfamily)